MAVGLAAAVTAVPACADQDPTAVIASAVPEEASMVGVTSASLLSQVTGSETPNATAARWDVHGTDLGHMFWHRGGLYMVFGDTFGQGNRHRGQNWRSNVLARLADPNPAREGLRIESMITGPDGSARELLPSRKVEGDQKTVIPTNGVSTGDRMFLHYMSVRTWLGGGNWDVSHSGLAYSDDDGETWTVPEGATWPGGLGFEQVAFVKQDGHVYSFGIPQGRWGDVKLRRVADDRMLDPTAYEYWDGSGWTDVPARAAPVAPAPAGELSVAWNARHGQWMMMYLDPNRHSVMLRLAPELTGPWSHPQTVVSGQDQPGLYAPYIVPLREIGDEVWFTMSKWGPYNVYLMRMTLGDLMRAAG